MDGKIDEQFFRRGTLWKLQLTLMALIWLSNHSVIRAVSLYHAQACYELAAPICAPLHADNTAPFEEMSRRWRAGGSTVSGCPMRVKLECILSTLPVTSRDQANFGKTSLFRPN